MVSSIEELPRSMVYQSIQDLVHLEGLPGMS